MLNNLDKYIVKYNWFTLKVWNYIFYSYSELESFCFSCFILFFPNTNREYYFLKNNITSLEIEDLKYGFTDKASQISFLKYFFTIHHFQTKVSYSLRLKLSILIL